MVYPEINFQNGVPLYQQLKRSYHRMAALGLIEPHEQLPPVRQLAMELGINPNTVQKAYRELEEENLIYAIPGKGNFLSDHETDKRIENEEILHNFQAAARVAWVAGISPDTLHDMLDKCIHKNPQETD
ncbi:MAG TPA: GntR family transcriptional regulator [Clostridia bacterium]|nr:GntR family transcriptional regulator [Clostridia bacterium]